VLAGVAELLAPGAEAVVLVSVVPRDGLPAIPAAGDLGGAYARHSLELVEVRTATAAEISASRSSWAKRLRAGAARPVTLLRVRVGSSPPRAEPWTGGAAVPGAVCSARRSGRCGS
jgi:hypothetical protein